MRYGISLTTVSSNTFSLTITQLKAFDAFKSVAKLDIGAIIALCCY